MIQTVTGKIKKEVLGTALMHEHISCTSLSYERAFGREWLDKEKLRDLSVQTLKLLKETHGLGLMVDATPLDLGRDAALLRSVSELSGVHIVASSGFYYLESIEALNNSPEELADWLIHECKNGIGSTDIKPGILKCATGARGIVADNQKKLSAIARVQGETGLALYAHCEHAEDIATQQIRLLCENGASAQRIIIGHCAIRPDAHYLEQILKTGCYICMDQCHCYPRALGTIANALVQLCNAGYTDRILLSNDYCIHSDFCNHKTNGMHLSPMQHLDGMGYIFNELRAAYLDAGGNEQSLITMLCKNPMDALDIPERPLGAESV